MNLSRCEKGHYYDGDKYVNCPHCARKDNVSKNTIRMSKSLDSVETEKRKEGMETGKALKDAVLDAMEKKRESEIRKRSSLHIEKEQELPVGILVGVQGSFLGKICVLTPGYNYIGYQDEVIENVHEIEMLKSCLMTILYSEEKNIFILKPKNTEYPIQIGRIIVKDNLMLRSYDKIVVKEEAFLFVPICGGHFSWGNYKNLQEE